MLPDFSFRLTNYHEILFSEAISLLTCFDIFEYDGAGHLIHESRNSPAVFEKIVEKNQLHSSWISFCVGYELLFKSMLCKHRSLLISKKQVSSMKNVFLGESIPAIAHVYEFVKAAKANPSDAYLAEEMREKGINYLYDLSLGTLATSNGRLKQLLDKKVIEQNEREFLHAATQTLIDIRRNFDFHSFFPLRVTRSLGGDLEKIYLPAIKMMINIYFRTSVS